MRHLQKAPTMDTYQEQAAKTAVYPPHKADQYLIAGLTGEVGELASIFAKHWRGDGDLNRDHASASRRWMRVLRLHPSTLR